MKPQRFRKKPVEVEAMKLPNLISDAPGASESAREIAKWCGGHAWVALPHLLADAEGSGR